MSMLRRFLNDESAATMVEYGVMVALIAAVAIATVKTLGTEVDSAFSTINSNMP
ncbi:MAG: Flp/Fap pilin component [Gemmatimonadota bacterium]|jgi:pilus assembly protein Flp/PilA